MTETLPRPKSRKESYLAKAAGMDIEELPTPASREELYLNAIAEGGGGGGTSDFDQLTNRPKYNGAPMTGETNIPESTTYTAGDGIDITNSVISATNTGKARVLTTDDYNYPTANPTGVALWLLEPGIYTWDRDLVVNANYDVNVSSYGYTTALVGGVSITNSELIVFGDSTNGPHTYVTAKSTGAPRGGSSILTAAKIVDALNSTATGRPLSANQGKVLKDLIDSIAIRGAGAPTTGTVGEVGQLYEDGTNGALYQLKSIDITVTPNTYNWEEVGAGDVKAVYLTPTNVTSTTISVTADKTVAEIKGWADADKEVLFLIKLTQGFGGFAAGVYCFRLAAAHTDLVRAYAVDPTTGGVWTYLQNSNDGYNATVTIGTGAPTVVQTTGTSTTDVMSQNAVTSMVYSDPSTKYKVQIGNQSASTANNTIAIGTSATATAISCIAIGGQAVARNNYATVAIGANSLATGQGSIALGRYSSASQTGEMNIGSTNTSYGYNSSNYRLLTGVYDGQSAHDAVNLGQLQNAIINGGTTAPTTTTVGAVGTQYTYVDTTGTPTAHLCVCTEIDTTDPSNPVYTWSTLI